MGIQQQNQSLSNHHQQLMHYQNVTRHARQLESELGGEDSSSIVEIRVSHVNMSIYEFNATPMGSSHNVSGNTGEKKSQQPQTHISKAFGISDFCNTNYRVSKEGKVEEMKIKYGRKE
ncbi:hypothetical protein SADUNF_Sadunf03G0160800 [Salix dunnii]|uniref:Uncharacterized protein n=1 Tax=Salix dunnii TaxID=1413687 RepID=A0A835TF82_9ROSI|nr:hypothetical protein SADUNF_Sadunf03G0160800 [Salix dunnii]